MYFIPAQKTVWNEQPSTFSMLNAQYTSTTFNSLKQYLTALAQQDRYQVAAIRAQLLLGCFYTQKACSIGGMNKQFYRHKAMHYLQPVALQDHYAKGQQFALSLIRTLNNA